MKTKTHLLVFRICILVCGNHAFSQNLYFGISGGCGFAAGRYAGYDFHATTTGTVTNAEYISKPSSLGSGIITGLLAGYSLNKNLSAELAASYLLGNKQIHTSANTNGNYQSIAQTIDKAHMLRIVPGLRIMVGENKLRLYMKIGFIVGLAAQLTEEQSSTSSSPYSGSSTYQIWEYKGGMSAGFQGGIGGTYAISEKFSLFAEASGNLQQWAPKKGTLVSYDVDGKEILSYQSTNFKEVEYVKSYSSSNASPQDKNQPRKNTRIYLPFSSVAINMGVIFKLNSGR